MRDDVDVDDRRVMLTRVGRRAYRAGLDGLSAESQLAIELLTRTGSITVAHLNELIDDCVSHYGSPEHALVAIKSGRVLVQPHDSEVEP